ncbi:hypothetical protein DAI22_03g035100 [Oryza sativa Japonica Group]|nr:hypothetical protein DAI22_03g035100 [Oryza sativa Japonica Group]
MALPSSSPTTATLDSCKDHRRFRRLSWMEASTSEEADDAVLLLHEKSKS